MGRFGKLGVLALLMSCALAWPTQAQPSAETLRSDAFVLFSGSKADKARAIELFEQAAAAGDAPSMAFLGGLYLSGDGVAADRQTAIDWYLKAAQAGHAGAMAKLAEIASAAAPAAATQPQASAQVPPIQATSVLPADPARAAELRLAGLDILENDGPAESAYGKLLEAAELGDAQAMAAVGRLTMAGKGTERNRAAAVGWFQKAAELGNPEALISLASLYVSGVGVTKDQALAEASLAQAKQAIGAIDIDTDQIRLLALTDLLLEGDARLGGDTYGLALLGQLAKAGNADAMYRSARRAPSVAEARIWWEMLADTGNATGMLEAGKAYEALGGEANIRKALDWYRRADQAGDFQASAYAAMLVERQGEKARVQAAPAPREESRPVATLPQMSKADAARAATLMAEAREHSIGGGMDGAAKAADLYRQAHELGDPAGTAEYGLALLNGHGDPAEGRAILEDAVAAGSAPAMTKLSIAYTWGLGGVQQDPREVVRLLTMAADLGDPEAMGALGYQYLKGEGVPMDREHGIGLMQVAAENGDAGAAHMLGVAYLEGDGVAVDPARAGSYVYFGLTKGFTLSQMMLSIDWDKQPMEFRREIQRRLKADGYYRGAIDGDAGPGTRAAIAAASGTNTTITASPPM